MRSIATAVTLTAVVAVLVPADGWGDDILNGGGDTLRGGDGRDVLNGGAGDDTLFGKGGDDELHGGGGDDELHGGGGDDWLHGDDGIDWLYGGAGDDTLFGKGGDDNLYGGGGDDRLEGGGGNDILFGGGGNDSFAFSLSDENGRDTIEDFEIGKDEIHFFDAVDITSSSDASGPRDDGSGNVVISYNDRIQSRSRACPLRN